MYSQDPDKFLGKGSTGIRMVEWGDGGGGDGREQRDRAGGVPAARRQGAHRHHDCSSATGATLSPCSTVPARSSISKEEECHLRYHSTAKCAGFRRLVEIAGWVRGHSGKQKRNLVGLEH
ncbi:hypothetical protein EJ110_NYTH49990 [Nymphaea thermarum]|nr:hypothetical protein EJ110_NYTH49990 [Nymphaea thermarum]